MPMSAVSKIAFKIFVFLTCISLFKVDFDQVQRKKHEALELAIVPWSARNIYQDAAAYVTLLDMEGKQVVPYVRDADTAYAEQVKEKEFLAIKQEFVDETDKPSILAGRNPGLCLPAVYAIASFSV
jgi:hypothetical protein